MKVVILAGGLGTRLAEETGVVPKPMIEIGARPILWHIMKIYAEQGFNEFIITLGYKGEVIKRFFWEQQAFNGSITIDLAKRQVFPHNPSLGDWRIHLVETGAETLTGGRLLQVSHLLGEEPFMLTYGDGVADIDLKALLKFHRSHGKLATVTAVRPPARFGGLSFSNDGQVKNFIEKPQIGEGWINGGFLVMERGIFDYIEGNRSILETDALEGLCRNGQLMAYQHDNFWHCMDTLRDKRHLELLWTNGTAPWKKWD